MSIAIQTLTQRILCICVSIDIVLNFDGDIDANAEVKCEQSINDITGRIHINKIQNYQSAYLKMYQIRSSLLIILIKLDVCLKSLKIESI